MKKENIRAEDIAELQSHPGWQEIKKGLQEDIVAWIEDLKSLDPFGEAGKIKRIQVLIEAAELFIKKPLDLRESLIEEV